MKRKNGFYWVRFKNDKEWTIALYEKVDKNSIYDFEVIASDEIFSEEEFEEIGEEITR